MIFFLFECRLFKINVSIYSCDTITLYKKIQNNIKTKQKIQYCKSIIYYDVMFKGEVKKKYFSIVTSSMSVACFVFKKKEFHLRGEKYNIKEDFFKLEHYKNWVKYYKNWVWLLYLQSMTAVMVTIQFSRYLNVRLVFCVEYLKKIPCIYFCISFQCSVILFFYGMKYSIFEEEQNSFAFYFPMTIFVVVFVFINIITLNRQK